MPSTFVPITGHLQAIASNKDFGLPSILEHKTKASLAL